MSSVSRETQQPPDPAIVVELFGSHTDEAYRYAELLTGPGVVRGLIGPREAPRVWHRHILNCAVVGPVFRVGASVCDLGSGAGLPGVVLALARPDLHIMLLEPLLRRATFLSEVVEELALGNVEVRRGRAEELGDADVFDSVTARAVAPLDVLAGWGLPLVGAGGELVALKGAGAEVELANARATLLRLGAGAVTIQTYGAGIVEPATTVVRIESGRTQPVNRKRVR